MSKFVRMCAMLAARNCYENGATVAQLAGDAGVSKATVYRWLRKTGVFFPNTAAGKSRSYWKAV